MNRNIVEPDEVEIGDSVEVSTATRASRFFLTMGSSDDFRMPLCRWDDDGEPMGRDGIPEHQWVLDSILSNDAPTRVVLRRLSLSGDVFAFQRIDDVFDISIENREFVVTGRWKDMIRQVRFPIVDDGPRTSLESKNLRGYRKRYVDGSKVYDVRVGALLMGSFSERDKAERMAEGLRIQGSDARILSRRL